MCTSCQKNKKLNKAARVSLTGGYTPAKKSKNIVKYVQPIIAQRRKNVQTLKMRKYKAGTSTVVITK